MAIRRKELAALRDPREFVTRVSARAARLFGYPLARQSRAYWSEDSAFQTLLPELASKTVLSIDRHFHLYQLARYANAKDGAVAEVGVYKGGTARLLARACPLKTVHLFDTFTGLPDADSRVDLHKAGDFDDTSEAAVRAYLADLPNVRIYPGLFPGTTSPIADERFSLVHVDADLYRTTLDGLRFFYPRMVPGGVMVFDDYEWPRCPGVKQALQEFLVDKAEVVIVTTNYQCAVFKI